MTGSAFSAIEAICRGAVAFYHFHLNGVWRYWQTGQPILGLWAPDGGWTLRVRSSAVVAFAILVVLALTAEAESPVLAGRLTIPFGRLTRLSSPDGRYMLIGTSRRTVVRHQCPKCSSVQAKLWLVDSRSQDRKLLLEVGSTAAASWSPDGKSFYVEDHQNNNSTLTYLYDTESMKKLDIEELIFAIDPEAKRFLDGHTFIDVDRWQDDGDLLIRYSGHTEGPPSTCFLMHYLVSRLGTVKKLSEHIGSPDESWCHY